LQQKIIELNIAVHSADILFSNVSNSYIEDLKSILASTSAYTTVLLNDDNDSRDDSGIITEQEQQRQTPHAYNPVFKVTVGSVTKKTSVCRRATNQPEWKENLKFYLLFPTLVRRIRFELCTVDASDTETSLAVEYLDIDTISEYTQDYYHLPFLEECFIDMHTQPAFYCQVSEWSKFEALKEEFKSRNSRRTETSQRSVI